MEILGHSQIALTMNRNGLSAHLTAKVATRRFGVRVPVPEPTPFGCRDRPGDLRGLSDLVRTRPRNCSSHKSRLPNVAIEPEPLSWEQLHFVPNRSKASKFSEQRRSEALRATRCLERLRRGPHDLVKVSRRHYNQTAPTALIALPDRATRRLQNPGTLTKGGPGNGDGQ